MERLEGLRAEAREVLRNSGDQFLDRAFRSGDSGLRTASQVMKAREREVRAKSSGPTKAGAASSGAASSSSAKPAPYPRAPPQPKRPRSRPPIQSAIAKVDAIIEKVLTKRGLGPTSQATAAAAAAMLGSIPKASGAEVCGQGNVVPYVNGNDGGDYFWPFMVPMLLNALLVIAVLKFAFRREPE